MGTFGLSKTFLRWMMKIRWLAVDADFTHSSPENPICPIVNTYFEFIDFPEDTLAYLNDLFEQVKPSIQSIPLEK